jgi:5-methylcytosine-specific restriction protein B
MSSDTPNPQSRRIPESRVAEFLRAACEHLKDCGGAAKKAQVMDAIRPRLKLTPAELSLNASGQERWDAATAFSFISFQKAGFLKRGGGTWRLLDAGRAAMSSMSAIEMLDAAHEKYAEWDAAREEEEDGTPDGVDPGASASRVWLIGTGQEAAMWNRFRSRGEIAIGFTTNGEQVGDLSTMTADQIYARIKALTGKKDPKNDSRACWEFAHEMRVGELVIARAGNSRLLAVGRITQPYAFDATAADYAHTRKVEWIDVHDRIMPDGVLLSTKTLTEMSRYPDYLDLMLGRRSSVAENYLESKGHDAASIDDFFEQVPYDVDATAMRRDESQPSDAAETAPSLKSIEADWFGPSTELAEILTALATKRAVVLQGSPGTGKSFLAEKLAHHAAKDRDRVFRVQFHPAYSYEDFVRGIRPKGSEFVVENGPLVRISEAAKRAPNEQFILFIDEINRGNVAKVLGEALSLIEADKRDRKHRVQLGLQYNGSHEFWIPPNVAVLATMNTADRSIALVDYALRRRFAFFRLEPAYDRVRFFDRLMDQFTPSTDEGGLPSDQAKAAARTIVEAMKAMNGILVADRSFGRDFAIGHSFFCNFDAQHRLDPAQWAARVFKQEICPLIDEYCVEHPKLRERLLALVPRF